jgi:uncharacterized membrane protein
MLAPACYSKLVFWVINAALGGVWLVELAVPSCGSGWNGALIVLAAVASIGSMTRQLPPQNVLPAAALAALVGGAAHALSALPGLALPFGPIRFNSAAGALVGGAIPWTVPLVWVIAVFNGRGVARLMLQPRRKADHYGFWLMGLTAVLATLFDVALEPYAWYGKQLWLWLPTRLPVTSLDIPLLDFLVWPWVVLLILLLVSPLLVRKRPGNSSSPDMHPLFIWLGALMLFAVGAARLQQWWPAGMDATVGGVTSILAVLGMRWQRCYPQS